MDQRQIRWPWRRKRQPEQSPAPAWPTEQTDRPTWAAGQTEILPVYDNGPIVRPYVVRECPDITG